MQTRISPFSSTASEAVYPQKELYDQQIYSHCLLNPIEAEKFLEIFKIFAQNCHYFGPDIDKLDICGDILET